MNFKKLVKEEKTHFLILELLFILYILFDIETPLWMAKNVDTPIGNITVVLIAITMFAHGSIAGILALLAAYTLIQRSSQLTGGIYNQTSDKSEELKMQMLETYNDVSYTLEEDVISTMAPIKVTDTTNAPYKPVLNSLSGAAPIDYNGVI